jgi:formyl-CoA transferase
VYALDEAFADPQVRHLEMDEVVAAPGGDVHVLRHPVTLVDTPTSIRSGPPAAGAHTRAVLAEIGYADDEIDALLASGVAATELSASSWLE